MKRLILALLLLIFVILESLSAAAAIVPLLVSPVDEFYLTFKLQIHSVMPIIYKYVFMHPIRMYVPVLEHMDL